MLPASTCSGQVHSDIVDLSSGITAAEVTTWNDYTYGCGGHGDLYSGTTHASDYYNPTIAEIIGLSSGYNYFNADNSSVYGDGYDQHNYDGGKCPGKVCQGDLIVDSNLDSLNFVNYTNCNWTDGNLQNSGDVFHCAAFGN